MADSRDGWAKFEIAARAFAAVGLPLIVGLLGYWHNQSEQDANRRDLALRDSIAAQDRRADRLTGLIEHLSSDNPRRRLMAIRVAEQFSLRNQLPPEIVPVLTDLASGPDSSERVAAGSAVAIVEGGQARRDELFRRLFSGEARERIPASEALVRSWRSDPQMVPALLRYAGAHPGNANGTFNTLGVLVQICPEGTRQHAGAVAAFAGSVQRNPTTGPRIQELLDQLAKCGA